MRQVRKEYSSDLQQLAAMRLFVREACQALWGPAASEDAINELELAVDEATSNIIRHAYACEQGRPIELRVEGDADQAIVSLYHCGRDFDHTAVAPPTFKGQEGGFGIYLIQRLVDEVTYLHNDQGRRRELSTAGLERALSFSWDASAAILWSLYRELLAQ